MFKGFFRDFFRKPVRSNILDSLPFAPALGESVTIIDKDSGKELGTGELVRYTEGVIVIRQHKYFNTRKVHLRGRQR